MEKWPCAPFTLRSGRRRSRGLVANGMQAGRLVSSMGSTSRSYVPGPWRGLWKGRNMVGGRRLFTRAPGGERSRTKTPKGRMFKVY